MDIDIEAWIIKTKCQFAKWLVQEAEMQEQTFAAGECPVCGHDWTAHSDFIARGEKTCVVSDGTGTHTFTFEQEAEEFDPAIMDERHPYYVADVIQCDEIIHTDDHPFCDDPSCGCHEDMDLIREYAFEPQTAGLLTLDEAVRLIKGEQL